MSGYLGRLAARAGGAPAAAGPRLPSRFERLPGDRPADSSSYADPANSATQDVSEAFGLPVPAPRPPVGSAATAPSTASARIHIEGRAYDFRVHDRDTFDEDPSAWREIQRDAG